MNDPLEALAFYLVFLFSVTCHEAAHAWAARRGGDPTAYEGGQVSLNPIPHIRREPFGMAVLPLVTVSLSGWPWGYASAPYDPAWAQRHPRRAAWMALAGPGANLALVLLAALAIRGGIAAGSLEAPDMLGYARIVVAAGATDASGLSVGVARLLSLVFFMNLLLATLNLIPVPPLDGSGALPLLLPADWTPRYQEWIQQPAFGWLGILFVFYFIGDLFRPVFSLSIALLYPEVRYA